MGKGRARKIRLVSGLILFAFVTTHFLNHSLGNISLEVMEAGRHLFIRVWRSVPGTILLYLALVLHMVMSLWALWQRRSLRMSVAEGLQLALALCIPFLVPVHILATRGLHEFFGVHDSYLFEILSVWVFQPQNGWLLAAAVLVVWGHGCIGLHQWLRLKEWYGRALPWLFTAAILLPAFALSGFAGVGKQIAVWARDKAWMGEALASFEFSHPAAVLQAFVYDTADWIYLGVAVVLALIFLGRLARKLWARRGARIVITYPDGQEASVEPGLSVLDASRLLGIAHASICGGRGRCSTCRVRIAEGAENLPPAGEDELKVLAWVGAPDRVRLACQFAAHGGCLGHSPVAAERGGAGQPDQAELSARQRTGNRRAVR